MERIEQLDWGAYSFFGYIAKNNPELPRQFHFHWADVVGGYYVVAGIVAVALARLLYQRRHRDAIVALLAFIAACGSIALIQWIVPRKRPEDAKILLTEADMLRSYPSTSVMLFTLAMIILGFALWEILPAIWQKALYVLAAVLLVVWVCMAQFFLALHFNTDVIGGLAGAGLFGYVAVRFSEGDRKTP